MTSAKKTVLIIDDEPAIGSLIKTGIEEQCACEAVVATSGREGLDVVASRRPDLVLLDIRMPEMDGLETLKQIKRVDPDLPVAIVTGVWSAEEGRAAFAAGAYEYITKPIDFEQLRAAVIVKLFT